MKTTIDLPEVLIEDFENKWQSYLSSCKRVDIRPPDDPSLTADLKQIFIFSDFIARIGIRHPEILQNLIESGDLQTSYAPETYTIRLKKALRNVASETELGTVLRLFRHREMVRIAWRDLTGRSDLVETMKDLSALADACVDHAFALLNQWLSEKYGFPSGRDGSRQHIVVLGMGKLGAHELNFSSDIDLVFAYPEPGVTKEGSHSITNEEYFLHLSRRFVNVFSATSSEGNLFRVDLRLRPYGENGPLIMNFDALEEYYQIQGREWERYAAIKSRVVAGDKQAGQKLLKRLQPFVYRRYLDFSVFDALRDMKKMISLQVQRKQLQNNIKLGAGGIREIEFFGQIFQLIRGGVEPALQERSILKVLTILAGDGYIPQNVCDELTSAYYFLRTTENRLQEFADQQTHNLPSDHKGKLRLAASMGFKTWEAFSEQLASHMETVHHHFNQLLIVKDEDERDTELKERLSGLWENVIETDQAKHILRSIGFDQPEEAIRFLEALRNDHNTAALSPEGRDRLNKLIPRVLKKVGGSENSLNVLIRILDLIKTIERRTCYIALLLENPTALNHLVKLANASPWIISFLAQHPVLLDELLDPRTLYSPPQREEIERELRQRLERVPSADFECQLEELCIFKQVNTLRVAAADISGNFPLMKVSDHLTDIAEIVVNEILNLAWRHMVEKYGKPSAFLYPDISDKGFAVIAYGKLGGIELGYDSDLDLVFLHAGAEGETDGSQPIDNRQFFFRLGPRIVNALTARTRAGALYEADMRLRPDGSSGMIVSRIDAFRDYYMEKAWTWEHQALVRARAICGDLQVSSRFEAIRKEILTRRRSQTKLREEVREMRERMRKQRLKPEAGVFDLKQDRGGLVDIEFLVQYLVLLHAHEKPELIRWSDNMRLLETLAATGILREDTTATLKEAFLTFRSAIHRLNLQEKPTKVPEKQFCDLRKKVTAAWHSFLEDPTTASA